MVDQPHNSPIMYYYSINCFVVCYLEIKLKNMHFLHFLSNSFLNRYIRTLETKTSDTTSDMTFVGSVGLKIGI